MNLNKYDHFIVSVLTKERFLVGNQICQFLIDEHKVTDVYARKLIERSVKKGCIKSSSPLTFSKGQFVYFLEKERLNKDTIKKVAFKYRPPLYRLLDSIDKNDGILSYFEALKITASPLKRQNSKVDLLDDLIDAIKPFELIYLKKDVYNVTYILLQSKQEKEESLILNHYQKLKLDAAFVKDILDWLIKSNLILSLNNQYKNKNNPSIGAIHNNLLWDAFGYTKTTGINPVSNSSDTLKEKQTLVVLDIVISREYELYDLDGFYNRIQINLNSVSSGIRKVLPIIVYKSCSQLTLNTIKKLGFLSYDIGSIYGSNIFSILSNISKLQVERGIQDNESFEETIVETLETIKASGQEDQLKALKGTLFEVMLFQLLKHQYPNAEIFPNLYFSKKTHNENYIATEKEGYEYDYVIKSSNPKEIVVVELKGYHADYKIPLGNFETKNTVKWFFNKTLPFLREKYSKEIEDGYIYKGAYITSSKFEDDALQFLEDMNKSKLKPKKLDVFYERKKLLALFVDNDFHSLKNIIEKFY